MKTSSVASRVGTHLLTAFAATCALAACVYADLSGAWTPESADGPPTQQRAESLAPSMSDITPAPDADGGSIPGSEVASILAELITIDRAPVGPDNVDALGRIILRDVETGDALRELSGYHPWDGFGGSAVIIEHPQGATVAVSAMWVSGGGRVYLYDLADVLSPAPFARPQLQIAGLTGEIFGAGLFLPTPDDIVDLADALHIPAAVDREALLGVYSVFEAGHGDGYIRRSLHDVPTGEAVLVESDESAMARGAALLGADLNRDGVVDSVDLAALLGQWGRMCAAEEAGACGVREDLNGDGVVNAQDLAILLASWGREAVGFPELGEDGEWAGRNHFYCFDLSLCWPCCHCCCDSQFCGGGLDEPCGPASFNPCDEDPPCVGEGCDDNGDNNGGGGQPCPEPPCGEDPPCIGDNCDPCDDCDPNCHVKIQYCPESLQLPTDGPLVRTFYAGAGPPGGQFTWSASGGSVEFDGHVATVTITQVGTVSVTVMYSVGKATCSDTCEFEVISVDLQIDSDNNNGYDLPDGSAEEKEVADVEGEPGKLILVNNADHDGDGVPGFADGFNLVPELESDEQSEGTRFVPLRLRIEGNPDPEGHGIQFFYDASPPDEVTVIDTPDGRNYTPAPGSLRIWMKDGDQPRDMRDVIDGGDFISVGEQYMPEDLGLSASGGEVILWVEAIRPSEIMGDLRISVHPGQHSAAVRLTAHGIQTVNVSSSGHIGGPGVPKLSHPTPVITATEFELTNVRTSSDYTSVLADVIVSGTITDKYSDLRPGPDGVIDTLHVLLNDELMTPHGGADPVSIPVQHTKGHDPDSLLRPYEYSGVFAAVIEGVEIQPGWNTVRLLAENSRGLRGFSERAFELTHDPPPDQEIDIRVEFLKGSKAAAILVDLFVTSDQGPTQHIQGKCTQISPGVYEIPSVLGGFIHISDTEDPASADLFPLSITLPDYTLSDATIWVERVDPAEPIFEGDGLIEEHHRPDWTGYVFDIEPVTDVEASLGGVFEAFLMEWIGPQDMLEFITEIAFHSQYENALGQTVTLDRVYELVVWDGRTFLSLQKSERPEIMLALPSSSLNEWLTETFGERREGTWNFIQGFGRGLVDTGVDFVDSVGALCKAGWYVIVNYNSVSVTIRVVRGDSIILEEDQQRLSVAWDATKVVGTVALKLVEHQTDIFYAILTRDEDSLRELGDQYLTAFEFGLELLEEAIDAIGEFDDYQSGRIVGRIMGEIVLEIGLAVGTGGAAVVAKKAVTMTNVANKITSLPSSIMPAAVKARMPGVVQKAEQIATAKQCFVAGTLVHTIHGLKPIEQISIGDLVLSRSTITGEQGYKPVVETFVTHPARLFTLTYTIVNPDGDESTGQITGTGEHPFHAPDVDEFVPLSELVIGQALSPSEPAATSYITDIQVERGPPSDAARHTTYNFEVAGWSTYFVSPPEHAEVVGPIGLWVHNASRAACERAFSIITRIIAENPGLDHWDTFVIALERTNTPLRRQGFDPVMRETVEALMEAMFKDAVGPGGAVDLTKVRSVKQIDNFRDHHSMGHRIKHDYDFHNHHTVPKEWGRKLLEDLPGYDGLSNSQWNAILDDMPGLLMNKHYHTNHGQGIANFHDILRQRLPEGTTNPGTILQRLEEAYEVWDPELGPKVWAVARKWLQEQGVP